MAGTIVVFESFRSDFVESAMGVGAASVDAASATSDNKEATERRIVCGSDELRNVRVRSIRQRADSLKKRQGRSERGIK